MMTVKRDALFLHLVFTGLFVMAFLFSEERLYADAGYYLSRVINSRWFWIEHDRLILIFSQIVPLFGIIVHSSLKAIIILYSLGHVLFFYALALLTFYILHDRYATLTLILVQLAGISQSYYTPQFELYYGIGLLIVFGAFLAQISSHDLPATKTRIALLIVLAILIITSHPVNQFLMLFVLAFDVIRNDLKITRLHVLFSIILILGIIFKFLTFSSYEQGKIDYLLHFQRQKHYLQLLDIHYLLSLIVYLFKYYWDVALLFFMTSIIFIRSKNYAKTILIFIFLTGYILLINITYNGIESGRYMEQVYFPIVFIVLWPFANDTLKKTGKSIRVIFVVLVLLILVVRPAFIIRAGQDFRQRMSLIKGMIAYGHMMPGNKFYIDNQTVADEKKDLGWSLPVESLLLSAAKGKEMTVSVVTGADIEAAAKMHSLESGHFLFTQWHEYDIGYLNPRYFHLSPGEYRLLNLMPSDIRHYGKNLRLTVNPKTKYRVDDTVAVRVGIENFNTPPVIGPLRDLLEISYHWYRDGQLYQWDGIRTPLRSDIYKRLRQTIQVRTPKEQGKYILTVEMLIEGKMWFGDLSSKEVIIKQMF
jgi:hypothetical protein